VIAVRAVRPGEHEPLRELRTRAMAEDPDAFGGTAAAEAAHAPERWLALAEGVGDEGGEATVYVAIDDGEWVGMAAGRWFDPDRGIAQLWGMWVAPGHRGQGLGVRLVQSVRGWAAGRDARFLRLGVVDGSPAIRLYERLGFVDTGERRPLSRDPSVTAVFMVRPA
jgi:GNAT superfamily N-acetyltransferase